MFTFTGGVRFHIAVVFLILVVVVACHIYSWFSPDVVGIGTAQSMLSIFVCIYVRLIMSGYLFFCIYLTCNVSTSMFGVSHAIQNEKKLWNLHVR